MSSSIEPQLWPHRFVERVNAGDLDGAVALYEPDARFVTPSGEMLDGRDRIRAVIAGLIDAETRMECRVVQAVPVGDVAILYTDFRATSVDAAGATVVRDQKAIEVLRRRADGSWGLIVGDPNGRLR